MDQIAANISKCNVMVFNLEFGVRDRVTDHRFKCAPLKVKNYDAKSKHEHRTVYDSPSS